MSWYFMSMYMYKYKQKLNLCLQVKGKFMDGLHTTDVKF